MGKQVLIRVPASTANLGSGFDSIGLALQMYTTIHLKISDHTHFQYKGKSDGVLPSGKSNIIYRAVEKLFRETGKKPPELEGIVDIGIPVARGLGSSGAAIVGGMVGANLLAGEPLKKEELFQLAAEMEGHPENVGASLFGGLFIGAKREEGGYAFTKMKPPENLMAVAFIPEEKLSTAQARHVLPTTYSKEESIHALTHSALLVAAFAKKEWSLIWEAMDDRLHQPYRKKFVPGFHQLKRAAKEYGALGFAISGAGPTTIAITKKENHLFVPYMEKVYSNLGIKGTVKSLPLDRKGVQILNM
ncbi:homoserine kinase [Fervidibacillus halotolerans]|uniref:Homoserine kinase n=1 Tax=Fervidibacillus halotolerans TaxID=2980027 RepID=A0A9E8RZW9_9BACI|nr:homoserine kinase [Fervidibacillus halotolerans]WAA12062.1 homoserine kinase [Fervidibacillus halotolerans]